MRYRIAVFSKSWVFSLQSGTTIMLDMMYYKEFPKHFGISTDTVKQETNKQTKSTTGNQIPDVSEKKSGIIAYFFLFPFISIEEFLLVWMDILWILSSSN